MNMGLAAAIVVGVTFCVDVASFILIAQVKRKIAGTADEINAGVRKGIADAIGTIAGVATQLLGQIGQNPRADGLLAHVPEIVDGLVSQAATSPNGATPDWVGAAAPTPRAPPTVVATPDTLADTHERLVDRGRLSVVSAGPAIIGAGPAIIRAGPAVVGRPAVRPPPRSPAGAGRRSGAAAWPRSWPRSGECARG